VGGGQEERSNEEQKLKMQKKKAVELFGVPGVVKKTRPKKI